MRFFIITALLILPFVSTSQDTLVYFDGKPVFKVPECSIGIVHIKKDSLWFKGTGFLKNDSVTVITAYHGVNNSDSIVYKSCGKLLPLHIDTIFPEKDIAVLKSYKPIARPLEFGNYEDLKISDSVIAFGYSDGFHITMGKIILIYKEKGNHYFRYKGYSQTGFSGGPVFNLEGKVIGITLRGNKEELATIGLSEAVAIYYNY